MRKRNKRAVRIDLGSSDTVERLRNREKKRREMGRKGWKDKSGTGKARPGRKLDLICSQFSSMKFLATRLFCNYTSD